MPAPNNCYLIILLIIFSQVSFAQGRFYMYEDTTKKMSGTDAYSLYINGGFTPLDKNRFNPGFTKSVYWLAYHNPVDLPPDSLLLHIGDHHINRIYLFFATGNTIRRQFETGDYYPFAQRPLDVPGYYFPISKKGTYLARIDKSNESLQLVFWTITLKRALVYESKNAQVMFFLTGMVVIMLLFGLYLFIITRERIYFYYVTYLSAGWLWVLANGGYGFEYFWNNYPWFASKARPVFAFMSIALSMLFMVSFVGSGIKVKRTVLWLNGILWAYVIIILFLKDTGYQADWWMYLQYLIPLITLAYLLLALYFLVKKAVNGNRYAQFYLAGALILFIMGLIQVIIQLGMFQEYQYFFSHFGMGAGYVAEAIIITAGLVYRFNQYRVDKERILLEMNRQQQENTRIMMDVQETERGQVANQLHDVAGSLLSAARLNLSSLREDGFNAESANVNVARAEEAVGLVSDMVRNLSHALSPVMIEQVGFKTSIEKVIGIFNASGKINIKLLVIGFEKYVPANNKYYTALYSIIYELLNNIARHSFAKNALIQVAEYNDCFTLLAEDDGTGLKSFDDNEKKSLGLSGIQSRVSYFGGQVAFDRNEPTGLIVTVEIPITKNEV